MKKSFNNILNEEYFIKKFNNSIEKHYKDMAYDLGDIIFDMEVLVVNLSNAINYKKYNKKYTDIFAEEVDIILYDNKMLIQNRLNFSFLKLLNYMDE